MQGQSFGIKPLAVTQYPHNNQKQKVRDEHNESPVFIPKLDYEKIKLPNLMSQKQEQNEYKEKNF